MHADAGPSAATVHKHELLAHLNGPPETANVPANSSFWCGIARWEDDGPCNRAIQHGLAVILIAKSNDYLSARLLWRALLFRVGVGCKQRTAVYYFSNLLINYRYRCSRPLKSSKSHL